MRRLQTNTTDQYQDDDDDRLNAELQHLKSSDMALQTALRYVTDDSFQIGDRARMNCRIIPYYTGATKKQ
jgi:hypothetical protein